MVREAADRVAASLTMLSGIDVRVFDVSAVDLGSQTREAASFLGQKLTDPHDAIPCAVRFSVGSVEHTIHINAGDGFCEVARDLATRLADEVSMDTWGQPFPPCPGHSHPRQLDRRGTALVWQCPCDETCTPVLLVDCAKEGGRR
ncbi:hypothetical protein ACH4OY_01920 [Micromonospora rubida]|uniref:Uncharacterized protein n=1 Tax=Micromonospora rubida TaxID=2697657 RepID=A0ABW7SCM6_9ACTN